MVNRAFPKFMIDEGEAAGLFIWQKEIEGKVMSRNNKATFLISSNLCGLKTKGNNKVNHQKDLKI